MLCRRIQPKERCSILCCTVGAKGGVVGANSEEIDWAARRHARGPITYFTFP